MAIEVITREDLIEFRQQLLKDLKDLLNITAENKKKWIKSPEVRKMLAISIGTLQNLRLNGTLAYTKIGGIIYYDHEDIEKLLSANKVEAAAENEGRIKWP